MSRNKVTKPRVVAPDMKYGDERISKLINHVMLGGKKSTAEVIVYSALESAASSAGVSVVDVLDSVIENVRPELEVRSRRVGGATYQVPAEVSASRSLRLVFKRVIDAARSRKGSGMSERLSSELSDAYNGRGVAVKKREDVHKMAESNRAFAHYRW